MSVLFVQQISIHHSRSDVDEKSLRAALKADYGYDGRRLSRFISARASARRPSSTICSPRLPKAARPSRLISPATSTTPPVSTPPKRSAYTAPACLCRFPARPSHGRNRCLPPGSTCNKVRLPLRWPAGAASRAACRRNKKAAAGCCFLSSNSPAASPASTSGRLKAVMCFQTASTMMMCTKPPAGSPNACTPSSAP